MQNCSKYSLAGIKGRWDNVWKGLLYFISFSFQHRKFYLAARGGMEFFKILASLSQIVLPGYIINELFGLRRAEYLFLFILLYTGCCFISGLAGSLLKCFAENEKEILRKIGRAHV